MKSDYYKAIAIAFVQDNFSKGEDIEEVFNDWWEIKGEKYFKNSLPEDKNILEQANDIIFKRNSEKDRQYGPFSESMKKSALVASILCNKDITTEDFFKCLIALKISRLSYNHKHDTVLDAIGYLAGLDDYLKNKNK